MLTIAHRGASGHAPENTLAAFRLALEMGAKAVEFDVHQTRDGELAVFHDWDLKRVGRPKKRTKVGALSLSELAAWDVGAWFDARFSGEGVPSLAQVVDLVGDKAELHVELKAGSRLYPGIEEKVIALLRARGILERSLISSFDHKALFRCRELSSDLRLGYLRGLTTLGKSLKECAAMGAESLNVNRGQAKPKAVAAAHERGLKVLVYTVNTPQEVRDLRRIGVDGVFTNFPELAHAPAP